MKKPPKMICWFLMSDSLRGRKYREEIDFIKANTEADMILVMPETGVITEDYDQCHPLMADLVAYAHAKGIGITLYPSLGRGFFNGGMNPNVSDAVGQLEMFTIKRPEDAQGIAISGETTADAEGFATYTHEAKWARSKIRPLRAKLLRVYAFDRMGEGVYVPGSLADITDRARIVECRTHSLSLEIDAGKAHAGKTIFVTVVQYYNWPELFGESEWEERKALMDVYAGIPLDGVAMDEYGYMPLNSAGIGNGNQPPFRGCFYSPPQRKHFADRFGLDLDRMMLDMHYAPQGDEAVRIRAVNRYMDELRTPIIRQENLVAEYAKKLFGEDVYLGVHNTFHNDLANDEVWRTACAWWDLPRHFGHTDETLAYPIRMGILLAAKSPFMLHMFYSKNHEAIYESMAGGAPFGIREIHHAFDDFYWGSSYHEPDLLENVRKLDRAIAQLDDVTTAYPRLDLLIIFGNAAQNNWYPDHAARNVFNIDGRLEIQRTCDEIWNAGYRAALVPDYAIDDGRVKLEGNRVSFNGHSFTHGLFLYPKYARKGTYAFLNRAYAAGLPLAVVGRADIDFDADPARLDAPAHAAFSLALLEAIGCPKANAIPNGCVYEDGSFILVHKDGILKGEKTPFDFTIGGIRYYGESTGIVACRNDRRPILSDGGKLLFEKAD